MVYGTCDVLVVGGGPAGTAAAVAAGRLGANAEFAESIHHRAVVDDKRA